MGLCCRQLTAMIEDMIEELEIPAVWREENPGYHRLGVYGQIRPDGWHCWGCKWANDDASISKEEAMAEHGHENVVWKHS